MAWQYENKELQFEKERFEKLTFIESHLKQIIEFYKQILQIKKQ